MVGVVLPDSLDGLRDWISSLDVLISHDTVAVHLAAALGCPVVGLYLATDGAIWSPVALPGTLTVAQSAVALRCSLMKPDGTCRRYYRDCPAPCRVGVRPHDVLRALDGLGWSAGRLDASETLS
jgi:ADP-heptose:LPS heptosyltransferase